MPLRASWSPRRPTSAVGPRDQQPAGPPPRSAAEPRRAESAVRRHHVPRSLFTPYGVTTAPSAYGPCCWAWPSPGVGLSALHKPSRVVPKIFGRAPLAAPLRNSNRPRAHEASARPCPAAKSAAKPPDDSEPRCTAIINASSVQLPRQLGSVTL